MIMKYIINISVDIYEMRTIIIPTLKIENWLKNREFGKESSNKEEKKNI